MPNIHVTMALRCRHEWDANQLCFRPALDEWVGLALVARTLSAVGTELVARDPLRGAQTRVQVTGTAHFDPAGERMKS